MSSRERYTKNLPGGFAEEMLAHESQVFAVPDAIADEVAALTEPYAVALHVCCAARPCQASVSL